MNKLSERDEDILELVIRDYITNAAPVSSDRVCEISDKNMSSASFRAILSGLEELGYLMQPYTSAGRVPTQKGYRFFVDSCMSSIASAEQTPQAYDDPQDLIHYIVSKTRLLGIYVHEERNIFVQFGIGEALRAPEFNDTERVQAFGDFLDAVQDRSYLYHSVLAREHKPKAIFIERENPVPEARSLSVVVSQNSDEGTVFVVGPSRMDYEQVLRILNTL